MKEVYFQGNYQFAQPSFQQRNTFFPQDKVEASLVVLAANHLLARNGKSLWQRALPPAEGYVRMFKDWYESPRVKDLVRDRDIEILYNIDVNGNLVLV